MKLYYIIASPGRSGGVRCSNTTPLINKPQMLIKCGCHNNY